MLWGEKMRAIVLSGGGSKGAYQIGVWKALRKLKLKYDVVTGTSVGALNAALMVQNNYYKALYFWRKLSFSDVIDEKIDKNITKKEIEFDRDLFNEIIYSIDYPDKDNISNIFFNNK